MDSRDIQTAKDFERCLKVLTLYGPDAIIEQSDEFTWDSKAREVRHGS